MNNSIAQAQILKIREDVRIGLFAGAVIVESKTGRKIQFSDVSAKILSTLRSNIHCLNKEFSEEDELYGFVRLLLNYGFAYEVPIGPSTGSKRTTEWVANVLGSSAEAMEDLSNKVVGILGLGGLGSVILESLAQSNINQFVLFDKARLDLTDLNRQALYEHSHVGRHKIDIATEVIYRMFPSVEINGSCLEIGQDEKWARMVQHCDIVFSCIDEPTGVNSLVANTLADTKPALLFGAVGLMDGTISALLKNRHDKMTYFEKQRDDGRPPLRSSLASTNGILAHWMAYIGFRYLINPSYSRSTETHILFD